MEQGKMYQVINGEATEVVRWGDQILPVTDHLTTQIIGQLTLDLDNRQEPEPAKE